MSNCIQINSILYSKYQIDSIYKIGIIYKTGQNVEYFDGLFF